MLNSIEQKEVKELQQVCEQEGCFCLKLNWDVLQGEYVEKSFALLHYEHEKCVGFIGFYGFGSKYEVCGMIHPDYRRKGIFTSLLKAGLAKLDKDNTILLNAPKESESGQRFCEKWGTYAFSESVMRYDGKTMVSTKKEITLRNATIEDIELLSQMDVVGFGEGKDEAMKHYRVLLQDNRNKNRIIQENGVDIGKVRLVVEEDVMWIYGFVILPTYQNQGYGKATLALVAAQCRENQQALCLEVVIGNDKAATLYQHCGFEAYETQHYYKMRL